MLLGGKARGGSGRPEAGEEGGREGQLEKREAKSREGGVSARGRRAVSGPRRSGEGGGGGGVCSAAGRGDAALGAAGPPRCLLQGLGVLVT